MVALRCTGSPVQVLATMEQPSTIANASGLKGVDITPCV